MRKLRKGESYALLRAIDIAPFKTRRSPPHCAHRDDEVKSGVEESKRCIPPIVYYKKLVTLLISFICVLFSEAQAQSAGERADAGQNEISVPEGGIVIGDSLPEAFWQQELKVINHPQGLAKIKLSDYRDKLLVLDFLNTACVPCIASVDKWHGLQPDYQLEVAVLPIHLYGDNVRIEPFAKRKEWTMPIAVGNKADTLINQLFYVRRSFGQVWIMDGKLLAIPHNKDVSRALIGKALTRRDLGIEMNDMLTYFDRRYFMGKGKGE